MSYLYIMEQFKIEQDEIFNTRVVLNIMELSKRTGKTKAEIKKIIINNSLKYGQHKDGYGVILYEKN